MLHAKIVLMKPLICLSKWCNSLELFERIQVNKGKLSITPTAAAADSKEGGSALPGLGGSQLPEEPALARRLPRVPVPRARLPVVVVGVEVAPPSALPVPMPSIESKPDREVSVKAALCTEEAERPRPAPERRRPGPGPPPSPGVRVAFLPLPRFLRFLVP
ncbi:hypothetical protein FF38_02503 [Lucilia cuprina]|uniref:Uncharacterized protein n=1 Tax=Lucilia cuprina TaxID=7375 RepID=A0A0L0BW94_LUCCU|nr:hypothetical protein FF38_02503 [Lucilia cuprina]